MCVSINEFSSPIEREEVSYLLISPNERGDHEISIAIKVPKEEILSKGLLISVSDRGLTV